MSPSLSEPEVQLIRATNVHLPGPGTKRLLSVEGYFDKKGESVHVAGICYHYMADFEVEPLALQLIAEKGAPIAVDVLAYVAHMDAVENHSTRVPGHIGGPSSTGMRLRFWAAAGKAPAKVIDLNTGRTVALLPDPVTEKEAGALFEAAEVLLAERNALLTQRDELLAALRDLKATVIPEFLRDHPGSYRAIERMHDAIREGTP